MNWILLAVVGHLLNAVAFIIDKTLLSSAFKRSATYAALIGSLSLVVAVAIPWVKTWPGAEAWPNIIGFGALFVLALWCFFEALGRAEASRVVPVVGSLIPLFTLVGTMVFVGETLTGRQLIGFGLLLIATALLSSGGKKGSRLDGHTLLVAVLAAVLFAASSVFGKLAYQQSDFLGVLITSRLVAGLTGLLIGLADTQALAELRSMLGRKRDARAPRYAAPLAAVGQTLGSLGFVMGTIALASGSAAIVNALQAVQYAAIVLVAWFGGKRLRELLKEDRSRGVVVIKSIAIVLVAIGLLLVSSGAIAA